MPPKARTKRTKANNNTSSMDPIVKAQCKAKLKQKQEELRAQFENEIEDIKCCLNNSLEEYRRFLQLDKEKFNEIDLNRKTSEEFVEEPSKTVYEQSILHALSSTKIMNSVMDQTLSFSAKKLKKPQDSARKPLATRNQSSDEGYLTAESTRSRSTERTNLGTSSILKTALKNKRKSRSLSRTKMPRTVTLQEPTPKQKENKENDGYVTPEKRLPPPNSFYVTPKVKPDNPITILRRPAIGEVAISMQGSPLLVNGNYSETIANINIPLEDGKVFSMQPCPKLRVSQIPEIPHATREQLKRLRDHLNIVCSISQENEES